jgi:hypothetical protein
VQDEPAVGSTGVWGREIAPQAVMKTAVIRMIAESANLDIGIVSAVVTLAFYGTQMERIERIF